MAMAVFTTAHNKTMAIPHIGKQTVFCDVMLVSLIISDELSASTFSEADGSSMCFQKVGDHLAASKAIFPEERYLHNFTP